MKKRVSNLRSLLLLLLLTTTVNFSLSAQDAVKEYREAFDVAKGITLKTYSKYSDVEILTWDKNSVDILAVVEVESSSKSKAEEKLKKIDVKIFEDGNFIVLETDLDEGWNRNAKVNIQIVIKAPAYLNLALESSYGDVFIQELAGHVRLDLKYGNLKAGALSWGNEKPMNWLNMAYSNGTIESVGVIEMGLAYSDLEIVESEMIYVNGKYSKLMGEKTGGVDADGSYDKYFFDEVGSFEAELRYSGLKFGALTRKLNVESKYTNIKILHLSKDFKEVNVASSYGNISMDVEEGASFRFEGESKYGKINVALDGKLNKSKEKNTMKIWGTVGSAPKGSMDLVAGYGNIDIR